VSAIAAFPMKFGNVSSGWLSGCSACSRPLFGHAPQIVVVGFGSWLGAMVGVPTCAGTEKAALLPAPMRATAIARIQPIRMLADRVLATIRPRFRAAEGMTKPLPGAAGQPDRAGAGGKRRQRLRRARDARLAVAKLALGRTRNLIMSKPIL
jgi:hypothetical protein